MSFNILREDLGGSTNLWGKRKGAVLNMLDTNDPAVIGLQECSWTIREDILAADADRRALGVSVSGQESGYTKESSNTIIYDDTVLESLNSGTFWLSKTPEKASKGWDAMFKRICTYAVLKDKETGFTYAHFNAHFDHLGVIASLESVAVVATKVAEICDGIPVVFTGDLNDAEGGDMYNRVLDSGFKDTKYLAKTASDCGTYHGYSDLTAKENAIDFIFANAMVSDVESYTVDTEKINGIYPSDHHPVITKMTLFN